MSETSKHAVRAVFNHYDDLPSFRKALRNKLGKSQAQIDAIIQRLVKYKFIAIKNGRVTKGKNWT